MGALVGPVLLALVLALAAPAGAAIAGRNGDLVFTTGSPGAALAQLTYWRIHHDGTGRTRITAGDARRLTARSPDGRLLATALSGVGLVVSRPGGAGRRVIVKRPDVQSVSWFPDSRRLAFVAGDASVADLLTVRTDARRLRRLTHGATLERVAVSPTGGEIAVGRRRPTGGDFADWDLVAYPSAGGRGRVIVRTAWQRVLGPGGFDWSPGGRALVIGSMAATGSEPGKAAGITLVRRDGSGRRALSPPGAIDAGPFFSPDGRFVAFDGFCAGAPPAFLPASGPTGQGICVMRRDGSQRRAVAQTVATPGAGIAIVSFTGVEWGSPWLRAARASAHPPNVPPGYGAGAGA